jgi:hypothetical protein
LLTKSLEVVAAVEEVLSMSRRLSPGEHFMKVGIVTLARTRPDAYGLGHARRGGFVSTVCERQLAPGRYAREQVYKSVHVPVGVMTLLHEGLGAFAHRLGTRFHQRRPQRIR